MVIFSLGFLFKVGAAPFQNLSPDVYDQIPIIVTTFNKMVFYRFIYYRSQIINKMGQQFKISEYPLIILFILTGGVFLLSSSDLVGTSNLQDRFNSH